MRTKSILFLLLLFMGITSNAELKLEKLWEFSQGAASLPAWMGANTERSMAVCDGMLYIASRNGGNNLLSIGGDGRLIKSQAMTNLAAGVLKGNNIGITSDKQVLIGSAGQQGFAIQKVDKDTGFASDFLTSPSTNVTNGGRIDGWGVYGTLIKGFIAVPVSYVAGTTNGGNEVLIFDIENGVVTNPTSPIKINNINGVGATATMVDDSNFYVLSSNFTPQLIQRNEDTAWEKAQDQFGETAPVIACAGGAQFTYLGKSYFASAGGEQFGGMQIFDISQGLSNATLTYTTPSLGNVANTFSKTNPVCVDVRADGAIIYVLSTNNGIAAYRLYDTSVFAGTYTVGSGGDYTTLYDAITDIKARKAEIKGDITLAIKSDITETNNISLAINMTPYKLTIRPDKSEDRTITFTSSAVNAGPYGALIYGAETSSTASVPTSNITIDGSADGGNDCYLKIQTSVSVYSKSNPIVIYGDVKNCIIRNCKIENKANITTTANNYAICFRRVSGTDVWPSNIIIENNEITNIVGTSSDGIAPDLGTSGGAGAMKDIVIKDNIIKSRARNIIVGYVENIEITGNTFMIDQSSNGLISSALLGFGTVKGIVNVCGNKFMSMKSANNTATGGVKTIITEGATATWNIVNNFFAGFEKTSTTGGSIFTHVECNTPITIYHNTFYINKQANAPSSLNAISAKTGANAIKEIQNNIFVSEETTTANCFLKGMDSGESDYNAFYFDSSKSACTFDGINSSLEAYKVASGKDANSTVIAPSFVNTANGDLHLAKKSIGEALLMVPGLANVSTDIDGDNRSATTYAGADEPLTPIITTPTALRATNITETSFTANWSAVEGITTYKLSIYTKNPIAYIKNDLIVEGVNYEVAGLTAATNYYYTVVAFDGQFASGASNEVLARTSNNVAPGGGVAIPGFVKSQYFDEQVMAYTHNPNVKIEINAPSQATFDPKKPTAIVMYALPNGNSTDWTIGKLEAPGDDWHYQIQHIGAQTRYVREQNPTYNIVTVYLEASSQSWGTWRSSTPNGDNIIKVITESMLDIFAGYNPYIIISGHSGGGNFAFGFMDAVTEIPDYVKKISFLDSNYNWDNARYGTKLKNWLEKSSDNQLSVICYDDVNALLNGQPIVSPTGGTWYRSQVMQKYLADNIPSLKWTKTETAEMITHNTDNNRIQFLMKTNPTRVIYHTVLVEKNGYIQALFSGTDKEEKGYSFFGNAAYSSLIQSATVYPHILRIPPRKADAIAGSDFMEKIKSLPLVEREAAIYKEFSEGNIPNSLRQVTHITEITKDASNVDCVVEFDVMPDYLAIGTDVDFVRIPMLPATAQKVATLFGATLPTRKLSDLVHKNSILKLTPITMPPDASMTTVPVFLAHNTSIEAVRIPLGNPLTDLTAGHKKDIVITNRLSEVPEKLFIYGWHYQNGTPIQPLSGAHDLNYVDYSHGVRAINKEMVVNGKLTAVKNILQDAILYKVISDEVGVMSKVEYTVSATGAAPPAPKSFAVIPESENSVKIAISAATGLKYKVSYGSNIDALTLSKEFNTSNTIIDGLTSDEIYYFSITASNSNGTSPASEKLAATPSAEVQAIIVNAFDRILAGNKYSFVFQHGTALKESGKMFASATNEAITENLVDLNDYKFVDYLLGEESTADKTFNAAEQVKVKEYLTNGGHLFVSGSEIGWDLGRSTSGIDSNNFMKDYLRCTYVSDNPGASAALYYSAQIKNGVGFGDDNFEFSYADGTTTTVQYPDVFMPTDDATGFLLYKNSSGLYPETSGFSGVAFHGLFPSASTRGKVIVMGIPFETIYPAEKRVELMKRIIAFENKGLSTETIDENIAVTSLSQNVPNPALGVTTIKFTLAHNSKVVLSIFDATGRIIKNIVSDTREAGTHVETIDISDYTAGIYYYRLIADGKIIVKKMIVVN